MKKLIFGFLSVCLCFGAIIFIESRPAFSENAKVEYSRNTQVIRTECIGEYKFVLLIGRNAASLSQMLTLDDKGNLVPATCTESSPLITFTIEEKGINWGAVGAALALLGMVIGMIIILRWHEKRNPDLYRHTY